VLASYLDNLMINVARRLSRAHDAFALNLHLDAYALPVTLYLRMLGKTSRGALVVRHLGVEDGMRPDGGRARQVTCAEPALFQETYERSSLTSNFPSTTRRQQTEPTGLHLFPRIYLDAGLSQDISMSQKDDLRRLLLLRGVPRCKICLFHLPPHPEGHEESDHEDSDHEDSGHDARDRWFSQANVEASARRGCENCAILETWIAHSTRSFGHAYWVHTTSRPAFMHVFDSPLSSSLASPPSYSLEICTPDPPFLQENSRSRVDKAATVHPHIVYGTKLVGGTGDERALSLAKRWFEGCRLNHPKCQAKSNPNFVPSRLLRINDNNEPFRLLDRDDSELRPPIAYATLSHRWSPETEAIILTTGNRKSRKQHGIAGNDLPRAMRDAILVLCRLGLSYVWIDSLCIVQDSTEDWQHEAGQMADVYSNAELTLSATWVPVAARASFANVRTPESSSPWTSVPSRPKALGLSFFVQPYRTLTSLGFNRRVPFI
jgi:hypothetical protein